MVQKWKTAGKFSRIPRVLLLLCSQRGVHHTLGAKILSCWGYRCPVLWKCGKEYQEGVSCTSAPSWCMAKDSLHYPPVQRNSHRDTKCLKRVSHWDKSLLQVPFQRPHKENARLLKGTSRTSRLQRTPLEKRSALRQPCISLLSL